MLFTDATTVKETPPLRSAWAPVGQQAEVPITGSHRKAVLFGTLNVRTGRTCFDQFDKWNQWGFQDHLRHLRSVWRGWNIVLFLDRGGPHTAKRSLALAEQLGIELRWLPTQCSELNPVEPLWREAKNFILSNEPTPDVAQATARAREHLETLPRRVRLRKAGVLSGNFWLPT